MGFYPCPLDLCVWSRPSSLYAFFLNFSFVCVLAFVYTLPSSMIQASTGLTIGLGVLTELIIGYFIPGRPIAMMLFKTWGYNTMLMAILFMFDLKLAHYMKIAHRPVFFCQVVSTVVAGTVQLGVQEWVLSNIEGICDDGQKDGFTCPHTTVFGNASIFVSKLVSLGHTFCISWLRDVVLQWSVIGPRRLLSYGQLYYGLFYIRKTLIYLRLLRRTYVS